MKLILKVPKLVKTNWGYDISFGQIALHQDDGKFVKNLSITPELLESIKKTETKFELQVINDNFISLFSKLGIE